MRALEPTNAGTVELDGFHVAWEEFGDPDQPTVLMLPTWQIVHSRIWKMQVPFLARSFHVVTYDSPGNGKSQRTTDINAFKIDQVTDFGIGVLDHLGIEQADVIGISKGGAYGLWMAARYPERVRRAVLIGTSLPEFTCAGDPAFWEERDHYEGWGKYNAHHWRADFDDWLAFFFGQMTNEPHSTKQFDDLVSWGRETTAEILIMATNDLELAPEMPLEEALGRVQCPVLLIHGTNDQITPVDVSRSLASHRPDFQLREMVGSGHGPPIRDPVRTNLEIAEFLERPTPLHRQWQRPMSRQSKRILFLSSPIGLGHIPRDLEIASQLRSLIPEVQIDWLASPPITAVLERAGETIHPLSSELSSKSAHWESMATNFDLHCFNAFREMDEIMVHNFMVFLDAVQETRYDLWIGDEAWEVDHFLHENPELKSAPFVFMTDFVGFLPMNDSPDSREAFLTADYNAEMIEHIERFPWVRDRSLYFGDFDDVVPKRFGADLPWIREWMEANFQPVGHVLTFKPGDYLDQKAWKRKLGYDPDRPLVLAAVGGTSAGRDLLVKVIDAWPVVQRELPEAQCVVVAGPRIDLSSLPTRSGVTVLPYVDRLHEHFAAADLGVVQGGLTTAMELVGARRPFLYFPLRNHFEQVFHVAHRLDRYNAGVRMDFHETSAEALGQAIVENIGADTSAYRPVEHGSAERAAREIAAVLGAE